MAKLKDRRVWLIVAAGLTVLFQNCGRFEPMGPSSLGISSFSASVCLFDGQVVPEGGARTAFQNSSVPAGGSCVSEQRTCAQGVLSGSFIFPLCTTGAPAACTFNGRTVASGTSVRAYLNSTASSAASCVAQDRVCTNGSLGGTYTFADCVPSGPAACMFNGQTLRDGDSVNAYTIANATAAQSCQPEVRVCHNGQLSGSAPLASCVPYAAAPCLFAGQTIADGASVTAWADATSASCRSESRRCANGSLSGSFANPSCGPAGCVFDGKTYADGSIITAYRYPTSRSCWQYQLKCSNGVVDGSDQIKFSSCQPSHESGCLKADQPIANGQSFDAYTTGYLVICGSNWQNGGGGGTYLSQNTCADGNFSHSNQINGQGGTNNGGGNWWLDPSYVRNWCTVEDDTKPTGVPNFVNFPPGATVYQSAWEQTEPSGAVTCHWRSLTCRGYNNWCSPNGSSGAEYDRKELTRPGHCPTVSSFDRNNPEPQSIL